MTTFNRLHNVSVGKFRRLLDYLEKVGIDAREMATRSGIDFDRIMSAASDSVVAGHKYSALYENAAEALQELDMSVPWGAGIGSDVFRFMCYSIINCQDLEQALLRSERYLKLLYPITGYKISVHVHPEFAELRYEFNGDKLSRQFTPDSWDRTEYSDTVAKSSGMRVWHAFMGWLVGRDIEIDSLTISAPGISDAYTESLSKVLGVEPQFNADSTSLFFSTECLRYRTVHTPESLEAFLQNAVYSLIAQDSRPASTGAAIRSLLAKSGYGSLPSFESMSENLHMSPSSLRRRLHGEGTSYQELKDQYRCDIAMRQLRNEKLKIHEIGEQLGFLEASSFIRSFRNWTGITPKQFRTQLEENE
ncbi:AraC family transcriptional regulator [Zhongshania sp. BJYM1]|uniref:AraC family transcriptional regulator n=1 Tax=Zhongshania aquatica TaxID=2965069 RepID=UPI0022B3660A|nr:AraC family transcriptional regulator [Marortus sp. BJYM1]